MILSLIKILVFVAAIAGLTWGATYLRGMDGSAIINVAGFEVTLNVLQMVVGALLVILAVWLLIKLAAFLIALFKFLNGDDTAISRFFTRNRKSRGYQALTEGMTALAGGDATTALAKARKADRLLERPQLTNLLTAQAAEAAGDARTAEETYKKMLSDESTRFVAIRGIMKQKLVAGETETAMQLAERAFALKPRHQETQDLLLGMQAEKGDWEGARKTLNAKLKSGAIPREVHRRRDAVLALSELRDLTEGEGIENHEAAIEANRLSPDLIPAADMAARAYIAKGEKRNAQRVLQKAWKAQPHPDLAACFAAIEPDETPEARIKRFGALTKGTDAHTETKLLRAELSIAAEDFPAARKALGDLVETAPTTRALTIMAAIERGEGADDAVVRGWLTKALNAPRGPQWVCDKCNTVHAAWTPICENCGALDTLSWRDAPHADVAMPGSTEMLPLITEPAADADALIEASDTPVEDAEVIDDEDAKS